MKILNTLMKQYSKLIYLMAVIIGVIAASGFFLNKLDLVNCEAKIIVERMLKDSDFKNAIGDATNSVIDINLNPPDTLWHYYPLSYTTFRYIDQHYGRIEVYKNKEAAELRIKYLESLHTHSLEIYTTESYGDYVASDITYKYHYNTTQIGNVVLITSTKDTNSEQLAVTTKALKKAMKGLHFTQQNSINASEYEQLFCSFRFRSREFYSRS